MCQNRYETKINCHQTRKMEPRWFFLKNEKIISTLKKKMFFAIPWKVFLVFESPYRLDSSMDYMSWLSLFKAILLIPIQIFDENFLKQTSFDLFELLI